MRARRRRYSELTSLIDVLFILLFASLVQQRRAASAAPAPVEEEEPAPQAPVAYDAGPPPADPHTEAREVGARLDSAEVILVHVNAAGTEVSIERGDERVEVSTPLLRETGDTRVVVYAADTATGGRLCRVVADALGVASLSRALILISTELPIRELDYALVNGLRKDAARCLDDAGGYALIVRPDEIRRQP